MKINNLNKIPADGKKGNSFVGIKIKDNQIEFHYPETYVLSNNDDELRKDILAILRSVALAKTLTSDDSTYNVEHVNNIYVFPLNSYLWIINDYLTYGRYENKEKVYINGTRGKINWKKTMHSNPAITNGNVVYTDIISEVKSQKDNIITEIYNCCVKQSIDNVGWLYGLAYDSNGVDYNRLFEKNNKLYINTINTELTHTFDDNKKTRLNHMKNILIGLDENIENSKEIIYGVDSYEYVFEKMVDSMFSQVDDIKKFYPTASWYIDLENREKNASKLRPDTVIVDNNKVYILDSKYYRYGVTFDRNDIPETTSIQKQITYGEYIKKINKEYDDVYSAFIMPYSKDTNKHKDVLNKNIEYVGIATAKWYENNESNNRKIVGILVDTKYLIQNWINKNQDNINEIIDIIEKKVRSYKNV